MIVVVGPVVIDRYYKAVLKRNKEADAQCLLVEDEPIDLPGCAGNVAANLASLKAEHNLVSLISDSKHDEDAHKLINAIEEYDVNHKLVQADIKTIVKARFNSQTYGHPIVRVDFESIGEVNGKYVHGIVENITHSIEKGKKRIILVADYNKGMITKELMEGIVRLNCPVFVDPKPPHLSMYHGADIIKPNAQEARELSGRKNLYDAGKYIRDQIGASVIITNAGDGTIYFPKEGDCMDFKPVWEKGTAKDVAGAGDTFMAAFAWAMHKYDGDLSRAEDVGKAIKLAQMAGSIAVTKVGCYRIKQDDLEQYEKQIYHH